MDTPREAMDKAIPKKTGIQKKHFGYLAIGIAIVVLIYMAFFADRTSTYKVEKDKLIIETVTEDQFNDFITVPGTVEPITTIKLDAQEGGRVEEKVIEEGTMVKKGDVILRLSNPDLYLAILTSEGDLGFRENQLRQTQISMEQEKLSIKRELVTLKFNIDRLNRNFKQNEVLIKDSLISKEEYIRSKEDLDAAIQSKDLYMDSMKTDSVPYSESIQTMQIT